MARSLVVEPLLAAPQPPDVAVEIEDRERFPLLEYSRLAIGQRRGSKDVELIANPDYFGQFGDQAPGGAGPDARLSNRAAASASVSWVGSDGGVGASVPAITRSYTFT